jgi:hypothetical protein
VIARTQTDLEKINYKLVLKILQGRHKCDAFPLIFYIFLNIISVSATFTFFGLVFYIFLNTI